MDALLSALLEAGLIDADTADIIRRQNDPEAARLWAEQQMAIAAQGALSAQQQRLIYMLRDTDYRPTERDVAWFWENENELLWDAMRPRIMEVLNERSTFAAVVGGNAGTFSLVNQQVIQWAETYYVDPSDTTYGSIPNLNLTSRQQFADAFAAWNRGELGGRADGLPQLIRALVPTFGADRAERIAVTETTRLFTESIRQAGLANPFTTAFRVLTANDERVCPICGGVYGAVVAKTDANGFVHPVRGSIGYPPFHVRCRCGITEETEQTLKIPFGDNNQPVSPQANAETAVEEATVAPLGPNGRPVSAALQLPKRGDVTTLKDAIAIIDSVHGDGDLPNLPVKIGSMQDGMGAYYKIVPASGKPVEIKINSKYEMPTSALIHEIGHFIDLAAIQKIAANNQQVADLLDSFVQAANNTKAIQAIGALMNTPNSDKRYLYYLQSDVEVWARAYMQYVAIRGDSALLKNELTVMQAWPYHMQWDDADFEPVAATIDDLFKALGWLR